MRLATYAKWLRGGAVLFLMLGGVMACNVLDNDQPTAPIMEGNSANLSNFIIGDPDVTEWGGQYVKDNTYFMVNIPIVGAVKVEYCVKGGGCFAVFVDTTSPTKWEIGLTTVDGVTEVLERVCVTYLENGKFASVPASHEKATQHKATHYQRKLDDGSVENWWPIDAAFEFGGKTTTVCVVTDGVVQGAEVAGPFPKPMPTPVAPAAPTVGGSMTAGYRAWDINGDTGVVTPWNGCQVTVANTGTTSIDVTFTGGDHEGTWLIPGMGLDWTWSDNAAGCPVSWSYGSASGSMTVGYRVWDIYSGTGVVTPENWCQVDVYNTGTTKAITVIFTGGNNAGTRTIEPGVSAFTISDEDGTDCPVSWTLVP